MSSRVNESNYDKEAIEELIGSVIPLVRLPGVGTRDSKVIYVNDPRRVHSFERIPFLINFNK
jgi:hypothetical protein